MDSEVKASGTETAAPSPGRVFVKAVALNHIHINVRDLARSVRFYREALGLVETFRPEPNLAFMSNTWSVNIPDDSFHIRRWIAALLLFCHLCEAQR